MFIFRAGQRVTFTATNHEKIPATILRECKARPGYWFCNIEGRLGAQCEHYTALEPLHRTDKPARLFVLVKGTQRQAAAAAEKRGIAWERVKPDCRVRIGHEAAGYVPADQMSAIIAWYCEDAPSGAPFPAGTCLFYALEA